MTTAPEPTDIWHTTYRRDWLAGRSEVGLMSAISEHDGQRTLAAHLDIENEPIDGGTEIIVRVRLTPKQMRDLATLLHQHADRIETTLIPLLHPAPALIEFELPPGLYREPEAA